MLGQEGRALVHGIKVHITDPRDLPHPFHKTGKEAVGPPHHPPDLPEPGYWTFHPPEKQDTNAPCLSHPTNNILL